MTSAAPTIRLDRRKFLAASTALVAAGVIAPEAVAQAQFLTFKQGEYDITILGDGGFDLPLSVISPDAKPEELEMLLGLGPGTQSRPTILSPLLLARGDERILIDTGAGNNMGPTAGALLRSLDAVGLSPAKISKVIYTHAHPDHLWGTIAPDGSATFPNATYYMSADELNFWTDDRLATTIAQNMQAMLRTTQAQIGLIREKITPFAFATEVIPGVMALGTPGHTAGHTSFVLAGSEELIIVGDAIVVPEVFFAHPEWKFGFDFDAATAGKSRRMLLDMAASQKQQLLGYHWTYPGLGRAEAKDGAFRFIPA